MFLKNLKQMKEFYKNIMKNLEMQKINNKSLTNMHIALHKRKTMTCLYVQHYISNN